MSADSRRYKELGLGAKRGRLKEIALVFLRLGVVAFGGPAAHVAMMEEETVKRRAWLSTEDFLDLLAATNLIPGPNSTEMAIHLGYLRGGLLGLMIAGCCFILPALAIVLFFAYLYVQHGQLPQVEGLLYGMKPVILAVILQALLRLGKSVLKGVLSVISVAAVIALYMLGVPEIPLMLGAAALYMLIKNWQRLRDKLFSLPLLPFALVAPAVQQGASELGAPSIAGIFLSFLKIGSVLYGSGYVLLAFLETEFVRSGLLSAQQLLDAVAVGQFTPGPVFTTATFVGYLLGGWGGALSATVGIFLPSFLLVFLLHPLIPRMRASRWFSSALDGLNAASLALMAAVSFRLGIASLPDAVTIALFLLALAAMLRWKMNSFWLILLGGLLGLLYKLAF